MQHYNNLHNNEGKEHDTLNWSMVRLIIGYTDITDTDTGIGIGCIEYMPNIGMISV